MVRYSFYSIGLLAFFYGALTANVSSAELHNYSKRTRTFLSINSCSEYTDKTTGPRAQKTRVVAHKHTAAYQHDVVLTRFCIVSTTDGQINSLRPYSVSLYTKEVKTLEIKYICQSKFIFFFTLFDCPYIYLTFIFKRILYI